MVVPFASRATQQFARKALSRKGCAPILRLRRQTPWHRSYGYDLRRLPCMHHDWGCNATHGRLVQRFLKLEDKRLAHLRLA